jgi:hypothetical protein
MFAISIIVSIRLNVSEKQESINDNCSEWSRIIVSFGKKLIFILLAWLVTFFFWSIVEITYWVKLLGTPFNYFNQEIRIVRVKGFFDIKFG